MVIERTFEHVRMPCYDEDDDGTSGHGDDDGTSGHGDDDGTCGHGDDDGTCGHEDVQRTQ